VTSDYRTLVHRGNFEANLEFLGRAFPLSKEHRILEIGSGTGALLNYLHRTGFDIRGINTDQEEIDASRTMYGELPYENMSGDAMRFPDESFDVVLSFDVFEHIPDSDRHLREVWRVLKRGGHYLLQTPNKWTNLPFEVLRNRSLSAVLEDHCSLHNYWQLRRRFERNLFEVRFYRIPVVNDFFKTKVRTYLGSPGVSLLKVVNPDRLPIPLRTNFYVAARKGQRAGSDPAG
jgi:SAM-dependent methyltransferase